MSIDKTTATQRSLDKKIVVTPEQQRLAAHQVAVSVPREDVLPILTMLGLTDRASYSPAHGSLLRLAL